MTATDFAGTAVGCTFALIVALWFSARLIATALDGVAVAVRTQPAVKIDLIEQREPREPWEGPE